MKYWKYCPKCRRALAITEFYRRRASHDGRQSQCHTCMKAYLRTRVVPRASPWRLQDRIKLGVKTCYNCQRTLAFSEFHVSRRSRDGRQARCRECAIAYRKSQYIPVGRLVAAAERLESGEKLCSLCKERKPLTEFHRRTTAHDGRQSLCKPCQIDRVLATVNIDRVRKTAREWARAHPTPRKRTPRVVLTHEEQLAYWRMKGREYRERRRANAPSRRSSLPTTQEGMRAYWREKGAKKRAAKREAAAKVKLPT